MKSLCRHHMVLLLFLTTLPYLNSHLFTQAASPSPPVTQQRILFLTAKDSDDAYDNEDYDEPRNPPQSRTPFTYQEPPHICQYNPCLEDAPSCPDLSKKTACLCPGVSGPSELPHAPRIHSLLPVNEGPNKEKIEVQWCAPSSTISGYRVIIEGHENPLEFEETKRKGLVGYLEVGTKVCVEAVNKAGNSETSEFSCMRYEAPKTSDHTLLVAVIAGSVILLLLLIAGVVSFWTYRTCQKRKRDSNDGQGNPSYSVGGNI